MTETDRLFLDEGFEEVKCDEPSLIEFDEAVSIFGLDTLSNILKEKETDKLNVAFAGELPLRVFNDPLTNSFSFTVLGRYLRARYHFVRIDGALYAYDEHKKIYISDDRFFHGLVLKTCPTLSDSRRKEVLKFITYSLDTPAKEIAPARYIPFKSLVYDIQDDQYFPYSPEWIFVSKFPLDYIPDTPKQESVDNFLYSITDGDPEMIELLAETRGAIFYRENIWRGSPMFYSPSGANGKSTYLNMVVQMTGRENVSFLSLADLSERFRTAELVGKFLNVGDDVTNNFLQDSSLFKKVVTGETILTERKGEPPFAFKPFCKCFFACNGLPPVGDRSSAFYSRILLIPMTARFSGSNCDPRLKDKKWSEEELTYLTKLSIDALKRLLQRGDYIRPQRVTQATQDFREENSPVLQFLQEWAEPVAGLPTSFLYQRFTEFCEQNGQRGILTQKRFSSEVCSELNLCIVSGRHRLLGGKVGRLFSEVT